MKDQHLDFYLFFGLVFLNNYDVKSEHLRYGFPKQPWGSISQCGINPSGICQSGISQCGISNKQYGLN
jgi:hypothetical protein